ncbi:Vomp family autotransporter [Bartonella grahamii]|uniref:Adhesin yadA n=1 Tax=Bartonella grahamii TaxID=33045 RepID=A0A336NE19_BARGR|nr:Vomp family autotransporter [Bartonella grahamii]SSZ39869.1 Adhesin yadA precursor [Bartonella grahamii]
MKKKYSTPNLIKSVSLSAAMTALLSSVSPILAANIAITGEKIMSSNAPGVEYPHGSHGSIVFAGDDNYCGVDNVVDRGGKQQQGIPNTSRISAKEQYDRFIEDRELNGRHPYGTTTEKEIWSGDGLTNKLNGTPGNGYMGVFSTSGIASALPEAYGMYSFATGCGSAATGNYSTVFGAGATAKAGGAQAFGVSALASGRASVAMGVGSEASGLSALAIGGLATASGKNSISMGVRSQATLDDAIAFGSDATASGINSVAIGKVASASGYDSIALGLKTKATDEYAVAIGTKAEAQALGSIAIGGGEPAESGEERKVIAKGKNSIAIGTHTYAETDHSVAIGINAHVRVIDGVAVGGGSVSRVERNALGYDPVTNTTTTKSDLAWKSTAGDFSVGNTEQELTRQITNVAAGSKDTDAVNVAQLKALRDVMAGAGGGWKLSVSNGNPTDVTPGSTVDFSVQSTEVGKDNLTIQKASGDNKQKVQFVLSDTLKLASVTTGQSSMSDDGFMIDNGPTITIDGIDAGKQQITGVADATEDDQAVTYRQLKDIEKATKTSWQLSVNGGNATAIGPNGTVNFQAAGHENKKNIKIEKDEDHNVTFDLADDIQVKTVTAGESVMSAAGFGFTDGTGPSITVNGIHAGDKMIKGVAAGKEDTDAVNYKQLQDVKTLAENGWKLSVDSKNATDVKAGSTVDIVAAASGDGSKNINIEKANNKVTFSLNDNLKLTSVTTGRSIMSDNGFMFTDGTGPSITVNGISAGNQKITKVAKGTEDTDAVNFAQLNEIKNEMAGDSLVKWDEGQELITIGKEKGGLSITVQNNKGGDRAIRGVASGAVNENSSYAINGSQLYAMGRDIARYFGGGASYENGTWTDPTFIVVQPDEKGAILAKEHHNVADALGGVNNSIVDIYNQINDATINSLVKWDEGQKLITIGKEKGGLTISVQNNEGRNRVIKGVAWGMVNENSSDAINGSQLYAMGSDIARYFGGGASYENGTWTNPTFSILQPDEDDIFTSTSYSNVADAFRGVNSSITNLHNRIFDITENSLVKWDEDGKFITIGAEKDGIEIKVANSEGENRIISGVAVGKVSSDSTEAINGHQLFSYITNIVDFFGGEETDVLNGIKPTFTVQKTKHNNVTDAFAAVDSSITDIYSQINNVTENSLVKWHEDQKLITIGKEKGGTKIDITGTEGARTIAGVKAAENDDEAVNKKQLDDTVTNINNNVINQMDKFAVLYDKNDDNSVNYNSVTLGGNKINGQVALHNVKDGKISDQSHDAINGSQINKISQNVAEFFGGGTSFENGVFRKPRYNLTTIDENGQVKQQEHNDVGSALSGLDTNIRHVNHHLVLAMKDVASYFGGGAGYDENGEWHAPTFNVIQFKNDGTSSKQPYSNVADAFEGVNNSFTNIHNQILDIKQNSLVQQEEDSGLITIGSQTDGTKIDITGTDGERIITGVSEGEVTEDSTDAINGSQLHSMGSQIANYFGGGASYEDGKWRKPTFKISQRNEDGTIVEKKHHNVADAFEGVDNSITDIYNQINNVTENSLVKQEGENGLITVGKATGGTKISIANKNNEERTLSGVKNATLSIISTEAVNGSQLFTTNQNVSAVTGDLKKVAENTSKYFGGNTDVLAGIEPTFIIQDTKYNNVFDAFTGVNTSITNIDNKIIEMKENNLVKQDGVSAPITIGKDTTGTEINVAGVGKVARKISGVRAAERGDEAVNKDQLDKSIDKISKDIETVTAAAVLYDKDDDGNVNYGSVTLGGDQNNGPVALHNVKDGSISENSHDAINGSQINKISADIAKFFGGGAKFINGAFEGLKYTLSAIVDGKVGQADFYDVGSALTGLDKNVQDVNQRLTNVSNEFNQQIEDFSKDALLWDDEEEAFVARHEKDGKKTNSKLKYLLDGEIAKGSTDAITGNQLYLMSNQLANYFGGGAKYENGKWTDPTFKIVQVNADGTTVEKEHHNVADAFGDVNKNMSNINNRIDDVIDKVDSDTLKWNSDKKAYDAGRDGKPSKIINVADGKIEKGSKDAVNGGQLWETNERVTSVEKDVKHLNNRVDNISTTVTNIGETVFNIENKVDNIDNKVNDIAEDAVRYDRDENGKKTNKITLAGGDPSEPVMIDNVADGKIEKGSKEAVNGGQLHDYTQEQMKIILDQSKHYTDQRINNIVIDAIDDAVDRAKQYTDMKFDVLNYSIESVKKEARQAAAIGLAVSNLRYNDTPGKLSVGFGTGLWRSQSAFAFGAGYTSENGKYRSNISATTSGGHWGVGAGFNMTLN